MVSLSIPWLRGTVPGLRGKMDPVSLSSDGCQTLLSMGERSGGEAAGLVAGLAGGVGARLVAGLAGVGVVGAEDPGIVGRGAAGLVAGLAVVAGRRELITVPDGGWDVAGAGAALAAWKAAALALSRRTLVADFFLILLL